MSPLLLTLFGIDRVLVDGLPVDVTAKFYAALSDLPDEHRAVYLWVGALCIN